MEDNFWDQLNEEEAGGGQLEEADDVQFERERVETLWRDRVEGTRPSTSAGELWRDRVEETRPSTSTSHPLLYASGCSLGLKERKLKIINGEKIGFCTYMDNETQTVDDPIPPEERVRPLTISQCSVCLSDYRAEAESCLKITTCKLLSLLISLNLN